MGKAFIKEFIKLHFHKFFMFIKNLTSNLYLNEINEMLLKEFKASVASGPFKGMKYALKYIHSSGYSSKIIGSYEKELHETMEEIKKAGYRRIIDIGCAEGYYAVGLAYSMPGTVVNAYDIDEKALAGLLELAKLNNVTDRIFISNHCDAKELNRFRQEKCLVICDIEGAEENMLDPASADALLKFDMLVEIHDTSPSHKIHDLLVTRFGDSHQIKFIKMFPRKVKDCQLVKSLISYRSRLLAVNEFRSLGKEWGFFKAK